MLRIWDENAGFRIRIFHPGSQIQGKKGTGSHIRIRGKEFKHFLPQTW
jgi:hypothetical protein